MLILRKIKQFVAVPVIASFMLIGYPMGLAQAELIGTDDIVAPQHSEAAADQRHEVMDFLQRGDVQAELEKYGVSADEAEARVAALSDAEVAQLADKIQTDPAGEGLGAVVGALVLIFLVLLFTDIVGWTNAYDFAEAQN